MIFENITIGYDELLSSIKASEINYKNDKELNKILNSGRSLEEIYSKNTFKKYWKKNNLYNSELFKSC